MKCNCGIGWIAPIGFPLAVGIWLARRNRFDNEDKAKCWLAIAPFMLIVGLGVSALFLGFLEPNIQLTIGMVTGIILMMPFMFKYGSIMQTIGDDV